VPDTLKKVAVRGGQGPADGAFNVTELVVCATGPLRVRWKQLQRNQPLQNDVNLDLSEHGHSHIAGSALAVTARYRHLRALVQRNIVQAALMVSKLMQEEAGCLL
jgi:hypothetical protein